MKNLLIGFGVVGVCIVVLGYYVRGELLSLMPAGMQVGTGVVSQVTDVPLTTASQYVAVEGAYPQISNTSVAFNTHIKDVVLTAQKEHEKQSEENWQARFSTDVEGMSIPEGDIISGEAGVHAVPTDDEKLQFSVRYTVVRNDERYVSLAMNVAGYTGGAHGYDIVHTFTFDRDKKREVTISDLYTPESLARLSEDIRPKLITHLATAANMPESDIDSGWLQEGTDPTKPENFAAFTLVSLNGVPGESITFYFQQYQVAAYVFGLPEVTVPYVR